MGGEAGSIGGGGAVGGNGSIKMTTGCKMSGHDANVITESSSLTHASAQYEITFETDSANPVIMPPDKVTVTLGMPLPEVQGASAQDPSKVVLGWYTEEGGNGMKVYDGEGMPTLERYCLIRNVNLYPLLGDASQLEDTHVIVDGTPLKVSNEGQNGDGWTYAEGVLTLLGRAAPYVISGRNRMGLVAIKVVGNSSLQLDNLRLSTGRNLTAGVLEVLPNVSASVEVIGDCEFSASADGVAGICCPYGAEVKLFGTDQYDNRGYLIREPQPEVPMSITPNSASPATLLTVSGGRGAAAIGAARALCGDIMIDNLNIVSTPNNGVEETGVYDVGNCLLPSGVDPNDAGRIEFSRYPVLMSATLPASRYHVSPRAHDEYGLPLSEVALDGVTFCLPPGQTLWKGSDPRLLSLGHVRDVVKTESVTTLLDGLSNLLGIFNSGASNPSISQMTLYSDEVAVLARFASSSSCAWYSVISSDPKTMRITFVDSSAVLQADLNLKRDTLFMKYTFEINTRQCKFIAEQLTKIYNGYQ